MSVKFACFALCESSPKFLSTSPPSRYSGSGPSKLMRRYSSTAPAAWSPYLIYSRKNKKSPIWHTRPGFVLNATARTRRSGYFLSAISAQSRLNLILRVQFQLLQPDLFDLFLIAQVRPRRQLIQLMSVIGMLVYEPPEFFVRLHQVRFQFFLCVSIHTLGIPPRVRLPRRVDYQAKNGSVGNLHFIQF